MRRLIYVPIIHADPELGQLAEGIEERAKAVVGASNRQKHKEVVGLYWQALADYWAGKDGSGLKIFQDGMAADGVVGEKMVKSLASEGSINHTILERLMENGAELMKTEDPELLKEEYFLTKALLQKTSLLGRLWALMRYRWRKNQLLQARDAYISKRINETLGEGEVGVCFLGAYHQILPNLAKDIEGIPLKDPQKVRAYSQKAARNRWEGEVETLGRYLITPIQPEGDNV